MKTKATLLALLASLAAAASLPAQAYGPMHPSIVAVLENMAEYPGLYFKETDQFVAWGYTPMETIVAATKTGAEVGAAADRLGTIEAGKLADMLVLDKDPLADIRNLRTASLIIQGGKVHKKEP